MSSYNVAQGGAGVASGAAAGAAMGSIVPGIGTAIGAIVGGIGGAGTGFLGGAPEAPKPLGPGKVLMVGLAQIMFQQIEKMVLTQNSQQSHTNSERLADSNSDLRKTEDGRNRESRQA